MPWGKRPTKDAISGETLRGAANKLRSGDIRMGKPGAGNTASPVMGNCGGRAPGELKHLSNQRKRKQ